MRRNSQRSFSYLNLLVVYYDSSNLTVAQGRFLILLSAGKQRLVWIALHNVLNVSQQHGVQLFFRIEDRIDHAWFDVRTQMVDVSVFCFVGANSVHQVEHSAFFAQFPVRTSNGRGNLCAPLGQVRTFRGLLDRLDDLGVSATSL